MYLIDDKFVLYPEKRLLAEIKGAYDEKQIKQELENYFDESYLVINKHTKEYNGLMPLSVYLFPTSNCGLRCKYCYSDAGEVCNVQLNHEQIDSVLFQAAKTAYIVARNAEQHNVPPTAQEVWFAGGGEPTFEWEIFSYAVNKAKELSEKYSYPLHLGILTNGNGYNDEKIQFIIDNFSFVQISFDGTEDVQNMQRPSHDNSDSFAGVSNFTKRIMSSGLTFGLRSTVSEFSVGKLKEITEYFISEFPKVNYISFEPLTDTDRSIRNNFRAPSVNDFTENFEEAMRVGKKYGVVVSTSLLDISMIKDGENFCGSASGEAYVTQANGFITGCTETMPNSLDSVYEPFIIGKIHDDGRYEYYNNSKGIGLTELDDKCRNCEFLHFCFGDCPLVRFKSNAGHNYRCVIKKKLIKDFLLNMIEDKQEYMACYKLIPVDSEKIVKVCSWDENVMGYKHVVLQEAIH